MRYRHQRFSKFTGTKKAAAKKLDKLARTVDGIVFDSISEATYYKLLRFEKRPVDIQVPVRCEVNGACVTVYKFDFYLRDTGQYVEYKGHHWEEQSKIRFKLALAVLQQPVIVRTQKNERVVKIKENGRLACLEGDKWRPYRWGE